MNEFLEYCETKHRYYADGRERISVTQVLDRAGLVSDFAKKDEEARKRGSKVHDLCHIDDENRLDLRSVRHHRGYLRAWRKYREESGFTPTDIEVRVDDRIAGYAGRFDRLGTLPGVPLRVLLDIKTSKQGFVADYVRLQLVAYGHAFNPRAVFLRMAVALKPDGTYKCQPYGIDSYYKDRDEWLRLVKRVRQEMETPSLGTGAAFEGSAYA